MKRIKKITSIVLVMVILVAFASVSFAADSYSIKPVKSAFNYGADVNFKYTGAVNAKDWIGIYNAGETPNGGATPSLIWCYIGDASNPNGTTNFAAAGQGNAVVKIEDLKKGKYEAFICKDDGYEVAAKCSFEVLYNAGEKIPATTAETTTTSTANPKTGDAGMMAAIVALVLSAAGIFVFRKKALN